MIKLYATPLSHYSRKVRLLLDFYSAPYEVIDVVNVTLCEEEAFANNPLMSVPVITDAGVWMIESDHIAAYLARRFDKDDHLEVLTSDSMDLNIRAMLNGIMKNEVELILAKRSQIPIESYDFYHKCSKAILQGLEWVETNSWQFTPNMPKYRELHLVCAWEHLEYYGLVPAKPFSKIREIVAEVSRNPKVKQSAPYVLKPPV